MKIDYQKWLNEFADKELRKVHGKYWEVMCQCSVEPEEFEDWIRDQGLVLEDVSEIPTVEQQNKMTSELNSRIDMQGHEKIAAFERYVNGNNAGYCTCGKKFEAKSKYLVVQLWSQHYDEMLERQANETR